jgi:hypothetical protein
MTMGFDTEPAGYEAKSGYLPIRDSCSRDR